STVERRWQAMSEGLVTGFFDHSEHASNALAALRTRNFEAKSISVVGQDSDEFRKVTEPIVSQKADKFAVEGILIGTVVGTIAAFYAMHVVGGFANFLAIGPFFGALSGACAGGLIGLILGSLLHFDVVQYDCSVCKTDSKTKNVMISATVKD